MHDYKDGDTVEVAPYGEGEVYEAAGEAPTVRVRFPNGQSARVDRRNLKLVSSVGSARASGTPADRDPTKRPEAVAGTQPPAAVRDKAMRGPRE